MYHKNGIIIKIDICNANKKISCSKYCVLTSKCANIFQAPHKFLFAKKILSYRQPKINGQGQLVSLWGRPLITHQHGQSGLSTVGEARSLAPL